MPSGRKKAGENKRLRGTREQALDAALFTPRARNATPFAFVLEALEAMRPETKRMFGCIAVYVGEKIVFALREKGLHDADNGVWIATSEEYHESLRSELPSMRSIRLFDKPVTKWQVLPADATDFEESALRACELVMAGDVRIGKVPERRRSRAKKKVK